MATVTSLTEAKILSLAGMRETIQLTSLHDMNNVTDDGIYSVWSGTNQPANWPFPQLGIAEVTTFGAVVMQLARSTQGEVWERTLFSGGWGPWSRIDGGAVIALALGNTIDANAIDDNITYAFASGATPANLPEEAFTAGVLQTWVVAEIGARPKLQIFNTTGNDGQTWRRFSGSTGWSAWTRTDTPVKSTRFPSGFNLDDIMENSLRACYPNIDNVQNAPPSGANGFVQTMVYDVTSRLQFYYELGTAQARKVWRRFRGSSGWTDWTRVDAEYALEQAPGGSGGGASPSALKTAPIALSAGTSSGEQTASLASIRIPVKLAPKIHRWRLAVRNFNDRTGQAYTAAATLTGVWAGKHTAKNGAYDSSPTKVSNAWALDSDGSKITYSDWSTFPIGDGQEIALSIGLSNVSGEWAWNPGSCWRSNASGAASNTGNSNYNYTNRIPFTWWIEAEVDSDVPVVAMWGDSISCGTGNDLVIYDAPIQQYARRIGALPYIFAYPGTAMSSWEVGGPNHQAWGRWDDMPPPDSVIHFMGQNDLITADLAEMKRRYNATIDILKANVSPNVYLATITPSGIKSEEQNTIRKNYNTWLQTLPGGAKGSFDFSSAVADGANRELLPNMTSGDQLHLSTLGSVAVAGTINQPIAKEKTDVKTRWVSLSHPNITSGDLRVQRRGDRVHLSATGLVYTNGALNGILPVGFRPDNPPAYGETTSYFSINLATPVRALANGEITFRDSLSEGMTANLDMFWTTDEPFPYLI